MYLNDQQRASSQSEQIQPPLFLRLGEPARQRQVQDQIQYFDAAVTLNTEGKRVQVSFQDNGPMPNDRKDRFIKRFIDPMLKHDLGRKLLVDVNQGNHLVRIAWHNGKFGFNGTIELDRKEAIGGSGSPAVIFIDEEASDWKKHQPIVDNPDIGLFHELLHALHAQQGTVVNDEEEMERIVIGIGKHTKDKRTENAYRDAKGLQRRCCWNRETL